ncbi:hypothetical protein ASE98_13165 [Pseudomonas sp. Leaf48]|uniref:hypothetical protein n=1 Tax=unclassified Pseudomonas TaxID=196821 RepID=UPI00072848CF|nr:MULTISPECIES: hypothetical protein [unclassified Pseudomonas]KQN42151.1 hypothetical protein ASE98_13165 [Pseudomonas sp. Leaf48]MDR6925110.1 hypothetical protein [Pseudomonas sp. BE134]
MTDISRVNGVDIEDTQKKRNKFYEKNSTPRSPIETMRVRYWYEGLKQRTLLSSAYALEKYFEKESFKRNGNGTIRHYRSKWSGYDKDLNTPKSETLKRVELLAPGSTRELGHPLWEIMRSVGKKSVDADAYMRTLSVDIQAVIFSSEFSGLSAYSKRVPVTQRLLEMLEKRASLDCVACLICLILEATQQKRSATAVKAARALHNVLLMIAIELQARKIASPFLDWVIEHILPLGVLPHLKLWMITSDYVFASAHVNVMVYQTASRQGKSLDWPHRVKVMQRLIQGRMGFDVYYAMRPHFEIRSDLKDIPIKLVKDFERASKLRTWGWKCILEGRSERVPPKELFQ